jgi:hypothetical protein
MPQPSLVALGAAARRRSVWMQLAEREITAKDGHARFAQGRCQRYEQQRLAISSGAMREHEAISGWGFRNVEKSTNGRFARVILKPRYSRLAHSELVGWMLKASRPTHARGHKHL